MLISNERCCGLLEAEIAECSLLDSWFEDAKLSNEVDALAHFSYNQPRDFWVELFNRVQTLHGGGLKTELFSSYHFYYDCIVPHLGKKKVAFKQMDGSNWREWTFDHLHRLVNYQMDRWKNQSEDSEVTIAIAMPLGINFLVALLVALRLGLKFSVFPLDSPLLPKKRLRHFLDQLKVGMIFTTPDSSPFIRGDEPHWLIEYLEEKEEYQPDRDHIYAPEQEMQLAVTCQTQYDHLLVSTTAQEVYLNVLRAGFLTLGLQPGMTWAYSPDCSLREQPFLLLTGLLFGVTTAIISESCLAKNPTSIATNSVDVLGVSNSLRNLWSQSNGLPKSKLRHWYRSVFDDDEKGWATFSEKNKIDKVASTRLFIDSASGGINICSVAVKDVDKDPIWPAFGTPWDLLQFDQQEVLSVHSFGVFKQHSSADCPSNFALTQQREGWEVASVVTPQSRGYTNPMKVLEELAECSDFIKNTFFLTLRISYSHLSVTTILLVFVDPMLRDEVQDRQREWTSVINNALSQALGSIFLPDKIEFFPLQPKCQGEGIDRNWCLHQYTSGLLYRKKELNMYHWLSLLKRCVDQQ